MKDEAFLHEIVNYAQRQVAEKKGQMLNYQKPPSASYVSTFWQQDFAQHDLGILLVVKFTREKSQKINNEWGRRKRSPKIYFPSQN